MAAGQRAAGRHGSGQAWHINGLFILAVKETGKGNDLPGGAGNLPYQPTVSPVKWWIFFLRIKYLLNKIHLYLQ